MRDYYEPKLLPRLLASDLSLQIPVRPLESLNRTQSEVGKPQVIVEAGGEFVTVRVRVKSVRSEVQKDSQGRLLESGVYDLRLFRDGQLVRWAPEESVKWQSESSGRGNEWDGIDLPDWRKAHQVKPALSEVERVEADGTMVVRFDHVRLPRRMGQKEIAFSAYAFNEDRVKSTTASNSIASPVELKPRSGKAYVISVGVDRTLSTPEWDLSFAVNDARKLSRMVSQKVRDTKQFADVVPVCLISDDKAAVENEDQCNTELPATKDNLQAVLDLLAGRAVKEPVRSWLSKITERAQPEDLVLISVSSHGYTDDRGTFHFVTANVSEVQQVTPALDQETLNTDELSAWLREVDAGELVLIVDACQSEATIQTEGFKPGPMGSRGLGQLAYDKGMRVLAASKAKESAIERGGNIKNGLLSYALAEEGLRQGLADWQPEDGKITIAEWLEYAEKRVPELFAEGDAKGTIQLKGTLNSRRDGYLGANQTPSRYQQPVLFDFSKGAHEIVLTGK